MLASFTLSKMSPPNLRSSNHKWFLCSLFERTNKLNILNMKQKEKFAWRKEKKPDLWNMQMFMKSGAHS